MFRIGFVDGNNKGKERISPMIIELKKLRKDFDILIAKNIPHKQMKDFYKQCDLIIFPMPFPESFGRVIAEAMKYEVPVLVQNINGKPQSLVRNNRGWTTDFKNPKNSARQIKIILNNPKLMKERSKKAQKWIKKECSKKTIINKIEKLYKQWQ